MNYIDFSANFERNTLPKRKNLKLRLFFLTVFLFAVIFLVIALAEIFLPYSSQQKTVIITVENGQGIREIADNLKEQKLIGNPFWFFIYARASGRDNNLKAGKYSLSPTMSIPSIIAKFASGQTDRDVLVVRVIEGQTLDDIANVWASLHPENAKAKQEFLGAASAEAKSFDYFGETVKNKSLEGYLFPDTYFIDKNSGPEALIMKMLDNLKIKINQALLAEIRKQNKSVFEILTLASIVEKEVGRGVRKLTQQDLDNLTAERKIVAGIFYNRIESGIALQSDATITYITKKKNPSPTYKDLEIDSPYNTYKFRGLPPGPISNPSLPAIIAAIEPINSDYLYFISKPDGTPVFAKTYEEHLSNKQKYLK